MERKLYQLCNQINWPTFEPMTKDKLNMELPELYDKVIRNVTDILTVNNNRIIYVSVTKDYRYYIHFTDGQVTKVCVYKKMLVL